MSSIRIFNRFSKLTRKQKIMLIAAVALTLALIVTIPIYAWFYSERKAAEMFKVKYPNSLYINAAHREDRKFFDLDEIDVDEEVNGSRVLSQKYAFSVSGEGTENYTIQLAHTNNNKFTYTIYKAEQMTTPTGAETDHVTHPNAEDPNDVGDDENLPENKLVFSDDIVAADTTLYYKTVGNALTGTFLNGTATAATTTPTDPYYIQTYGSDTNVHEDSVPVYWQTDITTTIDPNTRRFCDYYILEVSWTASHVNNKETDLVYLAVKRS